MTMNPEIDLLDQLLGGPMPIRRAVRIFGDPTDTVIRARVFHVLTIYVNQGLVTLTHHAETTAALPLWEVRNLINDLSMWSEDDSEAYQVAVTEPGVAAWRRDSAGFFADLWADVERKRRR